MVLELRIGDVVRLKKSHPCGSDEWLVSRLGADIGISISGIAGPSGGLPDKPVGTTWIGLSANDGDWARKFVWDSDRRGNKEASALAALQIVQDYLDGKLTNG